jgi:putative dehydrogenase
MTSVGLVGLGIMGSAMAGNLMRARYRVVGYDISAARRHALRRAGGQAASNAAAVAEAADVLICSLPSSDALRQTALAIAGAARRPKVVVETSTLPIPVKDEARRMLAAAGTVLLDCPLSGTGVQAREKDILVFVSGDRRAYRRVVPILESVARAHYFIGPFGTASKVKFVANLLVAVHTAAAAEAIALARRAGLDPSLVVKVVAGGGGGSKMFQVRGPMMAARRYARAEMKLELFQKDMAIIADFARQVGAYTPLFSTAAPIYTAATAMNPKYDTAAVCAVIERMMSGKG